MIENIRAKQILQRDYSIGSHQSGISGRYPIPRNGLVFEALLNGDATDSSGYGNNGSPVNMVWANTDVGYQKQCGSFNGSNSYMAFSNHPMTGTYIITCFWATLNTTTNYYEIIGEEPVWAAGAVRILTQNSTFQYNEFSSTGQYISSSSLPAGKYFVTMVKNNTSLKIYINGKLDTTATINQQYSGSNQFKIGRNNESVWYYSGILQYVRIYNRILSEQEIQMLYKEGRKLLH